MGGDPPELKFKGCDDCPVERVSWDDVQGYLSKLNQMSGKQYRLPTEQEWKHACDGGSSQEYCGSSNLDAVGWYDKNSGDKTHPVGQKPANGYGLYDMSGNVREWQQDCYEGDCSKRFLRGGSWDFGSEFARAVFRFGYSPSTRDFSFGFRVARSASQRRAQ
jgi:formylglycine-generating enzyme required for sulfatase activity